MAVALNSNGQLTGGYVVAGGFNLSQAKSVALKNCKLFYPQRICVLERENNNYVFNQRLASYRDQQQRNYIASIRSKCKSYGFVTENLIAICVQQEIHKNEQLSLQRNQQIAQQNQINAQNRARAYSEIGKLGKTILESGQPKTNSQFNSPQSFGRYKTCLYDVAGQELPITIDSVGLCPLSYDFNGVTGFLLHR